MAKIMNKEMMVKMLGVDSSANYAELKQAIVDKVEIQWQQSNRATSLVEVSRRYGKLGKKFGGLRKMIAELVMEDKLYSVKANRGNTILITEAMYKIAEMATNETISLDAAITNMANTYDLSRADWQATIEQVQKKKSELDKLLAAGK